ncbi:3'-5' exonuclease [Gimesia maris]|uniref:3'-5' exonuclease n=1 Tax=Gimesia maris TaxID=122 RepID=UPI0030DA8BA3
MSQPPVSYLVFDVEAIADGDLISRVRYPGEEISPADALARYQSEQVEATGSDFIPATFMLPVSVAVAKLSEDYRLQDLTVLDAPDFRPHIITKKFWQGWVHYGQPTFVTFNGRGYDLPVLELAAYRYGISLPEWFNVNARSFDQSRNRYNTGAHLDLMDLFSNFGAGRVTGGLNLLANLIGKPGKTGIDGSQVQSMYDSGKVNEINDYCRCDVLDTYFVFLRSRVLAGFLSIDTEQEIVTEAYRYLEREAKSNKAYQHYLEHWGDWEPPTE